MALRAKPFNMIRHIVVFMMPLYLGALMALRAYSRLVKYPLLYRYVDKLRRFALPFNETIPRFRICIAPVFHHIGRAHCLSSACLAALRSAFLRRANCILACCISVILRLDLDPPLTRP